MLAARQARSAHGGEQEGGVVENQVNAGLVQPGALEAGIVGDDATAGEEIGQYNQRVRRDGAIEDHQGDVLAVRELHRAHPIAGRGQPGRLDVEGEETVAREGVVEAVKRDGEEPLEGRRHPSGTFPSRITR